MTFQPTTVKTSRLTQNVWTSGPEDGRPLLLVHGNLSTGGFWRYVAQALPDDVRVIAPDLRGFGRTETLPVDATRGLGDMVDDVRELLEHLGLSGARAVHSAGWSMGAGVLQQYLLTYPDDLADITLIAPLSPYGFGGTKGDDGEPTVGDFAGSGGGGANPDFVSRLAAGDRSGDDPSSPRTVLTSFFGPAGNTEVDVDFLVDELLMTATGTDNYPGDATASDNWPSFAPGTRGVLNTMTPGYYNASGIVAVPVKPAITWVHGGKDQVVGDASLFDLATLGQIGAVPGWPGEQAAPPQPMVSQMRAVLTRYAEAGGVTREVYLPDATHGMPLEIPTVIAREILATMNTTDDGANA